VEKPVDWRVAVIAAHGLRNDTGRDNETILIRDGFRD